MSATYRVGKTIFTIASACGAFGHDLTTNHDEAFFDRYTSLLHEFNVEGTGGGDSRATDLTDSIQGVFGLAPLVNKVNGATSSAKRKRQLRVQAQHASIENRTADHNQSLVGKLPLVGKVGHINVSAALRAVSRTQLRLPARPLAPENRGQSNTTVNQSQLKETKAIEEATVSLPMASFALEEPQPVKNQTEHEFPGNASQKAKWEKKEKSLENEVEQLKARLANVSDSWETHLSSPHHSTANTFSAQHHRTNERQSGKSLPVREAESMQPTDKIHQTITHSASRSFVAQPPGFEHESSLATPAPKDNFQAQDVTSATIDAPTKKSESILALHASIDEDAVVVDGGGKAEGDKAEGDKAQTSSFQGWLSSLFSWLTWATLPPATAESTSVAPRLKKPNREKSFIWKKQSSERTAQAVQEESRHEIEVNDPWAQMESDDSRQEDDVRREDRAERERAETAELPHKLSKAELQGRHGGKISKFWSNLEEQDYDIEQMVHDDDLVEYAKLAQEQDKRVSQASSELEDSQLHMEHGVPRHSDDGGMVAIHEPWLRRQLRDEAIEHQVHDSPDLQMLQIQHNHHRHK
jgi:hypothetical protein